MRKFKPELHSFQAKVVGSTFNNDGRISRQSIIEKYCHVGDEVALIPEPDNRFDSNAMKVCLLNGKQIGYLSETCAAIRKQKSMRKQGSNIAAFIYDIRDGDSYFVVLTIVEWNDAVSISDATEFFESERQDVLARLPDADRFFEPPASQIGPSRTQLVFKKAGQLTRQGSIAAWNLSKKGWQTTVKLSKAAWIKFINMN